MICRNGGIAIPHLPGRPTPLLASQRHPYGPAQCPPLLNDLLLALSRTPKQSSKNRQFTLVTFLQVFDTGSSRTP